MARFCFITHQKGRLLRALHTPAQSWRSAQLRGVRNHGRDRHRADVTDEEKGRESSQPARGTWRGPAAWAAATERAPLCVNTGLSCPVTSIKAQLAASHRQTRALWALGLFDAVPLGPSPLLLRPEGGAPPVQLPVQVQTQAAPSPAECRLLTGPRRQSEAEGLDSINRSHAAPSRNPGKPHKVHRRPAPPTPTPHLSSDGP